MSPIEGFVIPKNWNHSNSMAKIDGREITAKRQTIRAIGKRRHAREGEELQLYSGMRTKHCFLIGRARCTSAGPIYFDFRMGLLQIDREGHKHIRARGEFDDFARRDGFADWNDMRAFWEKEHDAVNFHGVLIEWEPLQ